MHLMVHHTYISYIFINTVVVIFFMFLSLKFWIRINSEFIYQDYLNRDYYICPHVCLYWKLCFHVALCCCLIFYHERLPLAFPADHVYLYSFSLFFFPSIFEAESCWLQYSWFFFFFFSTWNISHHSFGLSDFCWEIHW